VDHGLASGQQISPFYDPMLAKIIAWGEDREVARRRLLRALAQTALFGVRNNRAFLQRIVADPRFAAGEATTAFIEQMQAAAPDAGAAAGVPAANAVAMAGGLPVTVLCAAAVLQYRQARASAAAAASTAAPALHGWTGLRDVSAHFAYASGDQSPVDVYVQQQSSDCYSVELSGQVHTLHWLRDDGHCRARVLLDTVQRDLVYAHTAHGEVSLLLGGCDHVLRNQLATAGMGDAQAGSGAVLAPMHGQLLSLQVAVGDAVEAGQLLGTMEAMKMEHRLRATLAGSVTAVHANPGQQVAAGSLILEIEAG
jgi:geranyl-CoA carboxylase alpha subunit